MTSAIAISSLSIIAHRSKSDWDHYLMLFIRKSTPKFDQWILSFISEFPHSDNILLMKWNTVENAKYKHWLLFLLIIDITLFKVTEQVMSFYKYIILPILRAPKACLPLVWSTTVYAVSCELCIAHWDRKWKIMHLIIHKWNWNN